MQLVNENEVSQTAKLNRLQKLVRVQHQQCSRHRRQRFCKMNIEMRKRRRGNSRKTKQEKLDDDFRLASFKLHKVPRVSK
eukprot:gene16773-18468_t